MTIKDDAGRVAVLAALAAAIDDELQAAKADLSKQLAVASKELGTKQVAAGLPDGTAVGKVTWVTPDPAAQVVDDEAFRAWVATVHPHQIETQTVTRVRPAYVKALLAEMTAAQVARWCDKDTGELHDVPGVRLVGRMPYQRMTWEKTGRANVAAAWRAGHLSGLVLPELEGGE